VALIFFEFPHDLDSLLDSLGVGLSLNLITLHAPHGYIRNEKRRKKEIKGARVT